uniref:mRNA guanylyltransferase n=1 Tax=Clandestinovirus TaxID=2831644 RepID=A0A8F8KRL5_9VIRU|nr:mRNA capping enzyme guanylyltransferase alpha subunit [Clandestinovirus]
MSNIIGNADDDPMPIDPNLLQTLIQQMGVNLRPNTGEVQPMPTNKVLSEIPSLEDASESIDQCNWTTSDNVLLEAYGNQQYLKNKGETEVECRFGLLTSSRRWTKFEPSLLPQDYSWVIKEMQVLSDKWGWKLECAETFDEISSDRHRKRWILDPVTGDWKCKYGWIHKQTTYCADLGSETKLKALEDCVYDVRLAVSVEKPVKMEEQALNDSKSTYFRHKVRHRFVPKTTLKRSHFDSMGHLVERPTAPNAWAVECSKVTTFQLVSAGQHMDAVESVSTTYECELELCPGLPELCGIRHAREEIMNQLLYLLCDIFVPLMEGREVHILDDLDVRRVDAAEERRIQQTVWNAVYDKNSAGMNPFVEHGRPGTVPVFPGVLPQALSRRHISSLLGSAHWITEKTDGNRFLMYIDESGLVRLWERSGAIYTLQRCGWDVTNSPMWLSMIQSQSFPIVIDGEMVKDEKTRKLYYFAFDILQAGLVRVATLPFEQRLTWLNNFYGFVQASTFSTNVPSTFPALSLPFEFRVKKYYMLRDMSTLLTHIHPSLETGLSAIDKCTDRVYRDGTGLCLPNDGFIVISNATYYDARSPVLKWKLAHNHTVDLELDGRTFEDKFSLHCKTLDGSLTCFINDRRKMQQADYERLVREIRLFKRSKYRRGRGSYHRGDYVSESCVVEMCYNPSTSKWNYRKIRTEKRLPNSLMTIVDTMERISDAISTEELCNMVEVDKTLSQGNALPARIL